MRSAEPGLQVTPLIPPIHVRGVLRAERCPRLQGDPPPACRQKPDIHVRCSAPIFLGKQPMCSWGNNPSTPRSKDPTFLVKQPLSSWENSHVFLGKQPLYSWGNRPYDPGGTAPIFMGQQPYIPGGKAPILLGEQLCCMRLRQFTGPLAVSHRH